MEIRAIQNFNMGSIHSVQPRTVTADRPKMYLQKDIFVKSEPISFGNKFKTIFPSNFFSKLLKEGVCCAYSNIPLIPKEDFRVLSALIELNKPIHLNLDYLNLYRDNLYPRSKKVLHRIHTESTKHPDKTVAEIMIARTPATEKAIRMKQLKSLNMMLLEARATGKDGYAELKYSIIEYIRRITAQSTQGIILEPAKMRKLLNNIGINDEKLEKNLNKIINKLPTEDNSVDAYIYERTKLASTMTKKEQEKLGHKLYIDLLAPSVASDEHFFPQALYREEERLGIHKGEPFRVSFLTSKYMNEVKKDMTPDKFISECEFNVPKNMQKQLDRFTEIYQKWMAENKKKDADKLALYIFVLKFEAEKRSSIVKLNIDTLKKVLGPEKTKEYTETVKNLLDLTIQKVRN